MISFSLYERKDPEGIDICIPADKVVNFYQEWSEKGYDKVYDYTLRPAGVDPDGNAYIRITEKIGEAEDGDIYPPETMELYLAQVEAYDLPF